MKLGMIVGDGNPDKFWKNIFDITTLTNVMNIFVKILHYGYRLFSTNLFFLKITYFAGTTFCIQSKNLRK